MSEFARKSLVYFESDLPRCALRYGETTGAGTCPAVLGVDSEQKCWNTRATCPVQLSFVDDEVTVRFGQSAAYRPRDIDCIPSLISAEISPGTIKPGESLGERSTLTVTFKDHPHPDTGLGQYDFYRADRDYDPVAQGSYWGKYRARQPYIQGLTERIKHGYLGQSLSDFESRTFFGESFEGPTLGGTFSIVAKDIFKQLDGDRAMAPVMSNGFLLADIDDNDMSFTLSPSGIGNAEYEASGYLAIGGKEIVAFTRSGDTVTITARARFNTEAQSHKAQDRVQTVLYIFGENVADIIKLLMVDYAAVPTGYIPIDDWLTETEGFLGTVNTAVIAEPTPVRKLVDELVEQSALCVWWDDIAAQIRLTVLRSIPTDAAVFDEHTIAKDTPLGIREQPDKRLSQVWTRYAQINPLKAIDDEDNYRSQQVTIDGEAETNNGSSAIKVVNSRWIPENARAVAQKLNNKLLARYRTAPRLFTFAIMRSSGLTVELGRGYNLSSPLFQGPDGARVLVPVQVVRLSPMRDRFLVEAEEMRFEQLEDDVDPVGHLVIIDSDSLNIDLVTLHDSQFDEAEAGDEVNVVVNAGVTVGSTSTALKGFDVGSWATDSTTGNRTSGSPIITGLADTSDYTTGMFISGTGIPAKTKILSVDSGAQITLDKNATSGSGTSTALTVYLVIINITLSGRFQGKGGNGGNSNGVGSNTNGLPGGVAFYTRYPINLDLSQGDPEIFGGAGGGAAANAVGGGGGAGTQAGSGGSSYAAPSYNGAPGTADAGGTGGSLINTGGAGGGPGLSGGAATGGGATSPGAAGAAIDGVSYVNITAGTGDIRGSQIN